MGAGQDKCVLAHTVCERMSLNIWLHLILPVREEIEIPQQTLLHFLRASGCVWGGGGQNKCVLAGPTCLEKSVGFRPGILETANKMDVLDTI